MTPGLPVQGGSGDLSTALFQDQLRRRRPGGHQTPENGGEQRIVQR